MDYGRLVSVEELKDNNVSLNVNSQNQECNVVLISSREEMPMAIFKLNRSLSHQFPSGGSRAPSGTCWAIQD